MASKIDEYRAGAVRCEQRAKKTRNQADRECQMTLAHAYLMLAEAEAEAGTSARRIADDADEVTDDWSGRPAT